MPPTIVNANYVQNQLQNPSVRILNVLPKDWYERNHIRGSSSLPLADLPSLITSLDRSKEYVTYCASYECHDCQEAARFLEDHGFNVKVYEGGMKEWEELGLPGEAEKQKSG